MKGNFLILIYMFSFLSGCLSQVNTTDAQVSKSIKESKKSGFFMGKYYVEHCTDSTIIVEEAWMEKIWFYEIRNGKVIKVPVKECQLCFIIKQTPNLKYSFKNVGNWLMENPKTMDYVGIHNLYVLTVKDCNQNNLPISLNLIDRNDTGEDVIRTKVGELVFKVKQPDERK